MAIRRMIFMPQSRYAPRFFKGSQKKGAQKRPGKARAEHAGTFSGSRFAGNARTSPSGGSVFQYPPQDRAQLPVHVGLAQRGLSGLFSGDDDNIRPLGKTADMMPEKFSQQTFYPVALDGVAGLAGNGRSQTRQGGAVAPPVADEHKKMLRVETPSRLVAGRIDDAPDNAVRPRPCAARAVFARGGMRQRTSFHNQALRRLRPLARRRRSTARPLGVAMRARKPCVRARLILLG